MDQVLDNRRGSTSDRLRPAPSYSHPVTIHFEIQNHTTRMQKITKAFKVYRLMVLTLVCVLAGIVIGLVCRPYASNWTERHFMYIEMPGELYLRFLKLMIIPLLVSNVILSFGTIQGKITSQLGKVAGFIYIFNNVMAITVAILTALLICPGRTGLPAAPDRGPGPGQANQANRPTLYTDTGDHNLRSIHENMAIRHYQDSTYQYRESHPLYYHTTKRIQEQGLANHHEVFKKHEMTNSEPDSAVISNNQMSRQPHGHYQNEYFERPAGHKVAGADSRLNSNGYLMNEINHINLGTKLPIDVVLDVLRNMVPDSLVGASIRQTRTRLFAPKELLVSKNGTTEPEPESWIIGHEYVGQPNVVGLLTVSVLTGIVLSHMESASQPLLDLCSCISELSLRMGMKAIHLAPFCIMFLLIGQLARARNLSSIASELFMYCVTVTVALCLHGFVLLPLLYYFITKKSPLLLFKGMFQALVASFATSSSSATMALMLNCLAELDLNIIIVRAFGPLGSVFNMNGTAIYEAVGVIFIAQTMGVSLNLTSIMLIGLCSAIASLSTAGIPSSGLMTMVIVLNAVNLPVLQLTLIYIVDFIIDRLRTVVNVWSGAVVCALIDHICPEHLFEEEMKPEKYREMLKYRAGRGSLVSRKSVSVEADKPQVISVTITPPMDSSSV